MFRLPGFFVLLVAMAGFITPSWAQNKNRKAQAKPAVIMENPDALRGVTIDRFRGKWQEIKRRRLDNGEYLAFKDTMLISMDAEECIIRETGSGGRTIKGDIEITGNHLVLAGFIYSVGKISNEEWLLYEDNLERTLVPVEEFAFERSPGKPAADFSLPEAPVMKNLEGSWSVYRREGSAEMINAESYIIEHLELEASTQKDLITGFVRFTEKNTPVTKDCRIYFSGEAGHFILEAGSHSWDMYHFKGDGKEWIFGKKSEVIYRARK